MAANNPMQHDVRGSLWNRWDLHFQIETRNKKIAFGKPRFSICRGTNASMPSRLRHFP